jgi:hypothetical protein
MSILRFTALDRSGTQNWNHTYKRSIDYCTIPFHFRQGPI